MKVNDQEIEIVNNYINNYSGLTENYKLDIVLDGKPLDIDYTSRDYKHTYSLVITTSPEFNKVSITYDASRSDGPSVSQKSCESSKNKPKDIIAAVINASKKELFID